jgi:predicted acyltransferase
LAVIGMLLVDNCGSDAITGQLIHMPWNRLHVADVVFPVFLLVVGVTLPVNKPLWTPSYVLLTGAIGLLLALTHWLLDVWQLHRPLRAAEVLGIDAIVAFAFSEIVSRAVLGRLQPHIVTWLSQVTGDVVAYASRW